MSTQQPVVPHPFRPDEALEEGVERVGERPRSDSPFSMAIVRIGDAGTWAVPEEELR